MLKRRSMLRKDRGPDSSRADLEAKLFRGLGDPVRLALLRGLLDGPRTAGELAIGLGLSRSNASNHLRCLLECGLVNVATDGRFNRYRVAVSSIPLLLAAAADVLAVAGPTIEECLAYGPPSRRALRASTQPASQAALTNA